MTKIYKLEDLDCANCAAKIEHEINKLERVGSARVSFMTQKLTLDAEAADIDEVIVQIKKIISKIEPDCRLKV